MGHMASYSPGVSNAESLANLNDGYVITGPGAQTIAPINFADTITVHNLSAEYVRGVITPDPALTNVTGNLSFVIAPGSAFQESFSRNLIMSVQFEAVTMPGVAGVTPVTGLAASANAYQLAVKFVEA